MMDKTQTSPSRENYEELEGLSEEEINKRTVYCNLITADKAIKEAMKIINEKFALPYNKSKPGDLPK